MKIIQLEKLPIALSFPDRRRVKVVHAHGCFDCLHLGHAKFLEQAKRNGDILVVTVTSDRYVNKGNGRPVFSQEQRAEMLSYLSCVDFVAISDSSDASYPISLIQPSAHIKGVDYVDRGILEQERKALKDCDGRLVIATTEKYSTTEIIAKLKA